MLNKCHHFLQDDNRQQEGNEDLLSQHVGEEKNDTKTPQIICSRTSSFNRASKTSINHPDLCTSWSMTCDREGELHSGMHYHGGKIHAGPTLGLIVASPTRQCTVMLLPVKSDVEGQTLWKIKTRYKKSINNVWLSNKNEGVFGFPLVT